MSAVRRASATGFESLLLAGIASTFAIATAVVLWSAHAVWQCAQAAAWKLSLSLLLVLLLEPLVKQSAA